jgi:hypothetical protein
VALPVLDSVAAPIQEPSRVVVSAVASVVSLGASKPPTQVGTSNLVWLAVVAVCSWVEGPSVEQRVSLGMVACRSSTDWVFVPKVLIPVPGMVD